MFPRTVALWIVLLAGCAGAHRNQYNDDLMGLKGSPGLFVGHSQSGEVVVAASHYDAMTGLATTDKDLGLAPRKDGDGRMLCQQEMLTGTHVPRWICRYVEDMERTRQMTRDFLMSPTVNLINPKMLPTISAGRGPGGSRGGLTP